jgi:hypothetical protein
VGWGAQCSRFDAAKFGALTRVYAALVAVCPVEDTADAKALDVKLQECFANAIDRETDGAHPFTLSAAARTPSSVAGEAEVG